MKRGWTMLPVLMAVWMVVRYQDVAAGVDLNSTGQSAQDVIAEVNQLRSDKGLAPYHVNSILMEIAQTHAEYIASSGVISHFDAKGSRPYERALTAGYQVSGDLSLGGFFSENIHAGLNLSASEVVRIWQRDSDHLQTLISPDLKDMGVGVAEANGIIYYVLDAGASADESSGPQPSSTTLSTIAAETAPVTLVTSTALEDGTVYHIVQPEEALWSIAQAYNVTIEDLKKLNGLSSNEIFVGQKLLIKKPLQITATPIPTITVTLGIPTSTATRHMPPTATLTATPAPAAPASRRTSGLVVAGIVTMALLAAGVGLLSGRKKPV